MAGYNRQSVADIIANAVIKAAPVNAEFNAIRDAFAFSGGHKHDGTSTEGAYIPLIADVDGNNKVVVDTANNRVSFFIEVSGSSVEQLRIQDGVVVPVTDNDIDLGAVGAEFKDLYIDGIGYIDTIQVHENATITGNLTVSGNTSLEGNTTIGNATTDTVTVTAGVSSSVLPITDGTYNLGSSTKEWQDIFIDGTAKIDTLVVDENATVAGTLNVTGATTATTLNATTSITAASADINGGTIDGTDIGVTSRGVGNFTTVNSNAGITGNLTGNVTGNVTGAVTGNVTGNITSSGTSTFATVDINGGAIDGTAIGAAAASTVRGTTITATTGFTGNLTGNVTGNTTGTHTGNVTATSGTTTLNNLTVNGSIDVTNAVVQNVATPTIGTDAANKAYVDNQIAATIDAAPGTLDTLNELAAALGDDPNFATTVSNSIATKVSKAGDSMTGNLSMGGNKVTGLADPTVGTDAVTKNYVDTVYGSVSSAAASATAAANSASSAEADRILVQGVYDTFDDRYLGAKASDPLTDNDGNALITGALYFDSSNNVTKVYNGAEWQAASSSIEGIKSDFLYTATASQTVFSGVDSNGNTLVIDQAGLTSVFMNGVRLVQGSDYTVSATNDSVTLLTGATAGDTIEIEVFGNFAGQSGADVAITGGSITGLSALGVAGNATFGDNNKAIFGAGSDLQIYHDGSNSYVSEAGVGALRLQGTNLQLQSSAGVNYLQGINNDRVDIYHNGSVKLATTSTGVDVTGTVTADGLTVDGAASAQIVLNEGDTTDLNTRIINNTGKLSTQTWSDAGGLVGTRMLIDHATGDISFYEDTGTTAKLFWDASAEALGIGTSSPATYGQVASVVSTSKGAFAAHSSGGAGARTGYIFSQGNYGWLDYDPVSSAGVRLSALNNIQFGINSNANYGVATFTERMRIDASGNVGIGTTSPSAKLHVVGETNGTLRVDTSASGYLDLSMYSNGGFVATSTAQPLRLGTNNTERMRIDASGNLLVGTTTASGKVRVKSDTSQGGDSTALTLHQGNFGNGGTTLIKMGTEGGGWSKGAIGFMRTGDYDKGALIFCTEGSSNTADVSSSNERMRIDASGRLLINRTSVTTSGIINLKIGTGDRDVGARIQALTDGNWALAFQNSADTNVGRIVINGGSTSYVTTSDYRLKEDVQPMVGASDRVLALKPVNFAWKADGTRVDGFLAHEAQAVVPEAVSGTKDAMRTEEYEVTPAVLDDEGNVVTEAVMGTREVPEYQGIDQSKLVPLLTAALQEALTEIASLKARLDAANI